MAIANTQNGARTARAKIGTLEELGTITEKARRDGQSVVLAHGTFDLLHLGHVRHLELARREGDVLIVTVTADAFVNKGPGRPAFTEVLRAEMLAALACVDWVAINRAPTAEPAIRAIRPDVYVKGSDYADPGKDVTGKIVDERQAVEAHGGRMVITDDITFSSSELINRHLDVLDPEVREHLDRVRQTVGLDRLLETVESVKDMRVLLIGEAILDEYQYVAMSGQPAKEHIVATRHQSNELFAGGVLAAANHVAGFCREVEVLTVLGADDPHEDFIRRSLKPNVTLTALKRDGAPTPRKLRYVDVSYLRKLFEVQFLDDSPLPPALRATLDRHIAMHAGAFDCVVVADFGHGMIERSTVETIIANARFLAVNAQTNSANRGFNLVTKYPRADYVCIDAPEAQLAVADRFADMAVVAGTLLPARVDSDRIIVTHGRYGCVAWEKDAGTTRIPAITNRVVDTMGAGDAFLAVTGPLAATGAAIADVALIGNVVGALKVGIVGHRSSIDKVGVVKALTALLK
jgi:rfaE bifunctional protein nucleotidyltransferase chain/domain